MDSVPNNAEARHSRQPVLRTDSEDNVSQAKWPRDFAHAEHLYKRQDLDLARLVHSFEHSETDDEMLTQISHVADDSARLTAGRMCATQQRNSVLMKWLLIPHIRGQRSCRTTCFASTHLRARIAAGRTANPSHKSTPTRREGGSPERTHATKKKQT